MPVKRPKHLNLFVIRQPVPAVLSILNRVSGALIVVALPFLLYALQASLASEADFERYKGFLDFPLTKLVLFGLVWAYAHHFCAGVRYLLIDIGICADLKGARASAYAAFAVSLAVTALVGVCLLW